MSSRRRLRVLHTADVHLGSDGYGDAARQAAHLARSLDTFRGIVDEALAREADLLLIAGDLFDHNRVPDELVAFVRGELGRLRRPVVILPGNHDALDGGGVYRRPGAFAGADHVHVLQRRDGETVALPALGAVVWGRAMEEHTPDFRPLAHLPPRDGRWSLAMAHGFFYETGQRPERSSPIFADEIRAGAWDYVALGHQHVQTDVSQAGATAWYAGAPAPDFDARPGAVLEIDCSEAHGVRVTARHIG